MTQKMLISEPVKSEEIWEAIKPYIKHDEGLKTPELGKIISFTLEMITGSEPTLEITSLDEEVTIFTIENQFEIANELHKSFDIPISTTTALWLTCEVGKLPELLLKMFLMREVSKV